MFATCSELARPSGVPYLFLDEVRNVRGWARWVRALAETGAARVAVSGSSSRLLEPDIATVLTGRSVTWTLWPLSFGEYLITYNRVKIVYGLAMDQVRAHLGYLAECYLARERPSSTTTSPATRTRDRHEDVDREGGDPIAVRPLWSWLLRDASGSRTGGGA